MLLDIFACILIAILPIIATAVTVAAIIEDPDSIDTKAMAKASKTQIPRPVGLKDTHLERRYDPNTAGGTKLVEIRRYYN